MIGDWQSASKPHHEQFIELSESYRQAGMDFCHRMIQHESQQTWPNACVVLLLAAHSVELFLKGAILRREPSAILNSNHRLDELNLRYSQLFPEKNLRFNSPFRSECPRIFEGEIDTQGTNEYIPSIRFRYPTQRSGEEWPGLYAFEATSFFEILNVLGNDYERISKYM